MPSWGRSSCFCSGCRVNEPFSEVKETYFRYLALKQAGVMHSHQWVLEVKHHGSTPLESASPLSLLPAFSFKAMNLLCPRNHFTPRYRI